MRKYNENERKFSPEGPKFSLFSHFLDPDQENEGKCKKKERSKLI